MKTPLRQRLTLLAVGVAVGLGATEVGLRLWARTDTPLAAKLLEWDPDGSLIEPLGPNCFRARPFAVLRYPNGVRVRVNGQGFRGPEVAIPKPPATYRVVLLGGSTTHGFLVDDEHTIDAHLRRALAPVMGGRRVEVVNLGLDGLDAICDLERLRREGLRLEPDAVVIHDGVNDVVGLRFDRLAADDPARGFRATLRRAEDARARERSVWRRLKHALFVARLPGVVRHFATPSAAALPAPTEPSPAALDAFEATIREMAAIVPATATIVLSTPPSALVREPRRPIACGAMVVDAATTQRYRDRLDDRMRRVAADLARAGRSAIYVGHDLPDAAFLDECHLTGDGNRLIASDLARALAPDVLSRAAGPGMSDAR